MLMNTKGAELLGDNLCRSFALPRISRSLLGYIPRWNDSLQCAMAPAMPSCVWRAESSLRDAGAGAEWHLRRRRPASTVRKRVSRREMLLRHLLMASPDGAARLLLGDSTASSSSSVRSGVSMNSLRVRDDDDDDRALELEQELRRRGKCAAFDLAPKLSVRRPTSLLRLGSWNGRALLERLRWREMTKSQDSSESEPEPELADEALTEDARKSRSKKGPSSWLSWQHASAAEAEAMVGTARRAASSRRTCICIS